MATSRRRERRREADSRERDDEQQVLRRLSELGPVGKLIPGLARNIVDFIANPDTVSVYTYQRMLETDETVSSAVELLVRSVVSKLGEYSHPSEEITEFVRSVFDAMRGTLGQVSREILTAKWAGYSVSEIVYALGTFGSRPVVGWERISTLPPASIAFEIDAIGQITEDGILQFDRPLRRTVDWLLDNLRVPDRLAGLGNQPWPRRLGKLVGKFTRIPRDKVIHYATGSPLFGNPYGRSPLRRAYKSWLMKDLVLRMLLVALDRKGTPLLYGHAPQQDVVVLGPDGKPLMDGEEPRTESAMSLMARTLSNVHQESAIVLGPKDSGYELDSVGFSSPGREFGEALGYLNRAIIHSMLLPSLVLGEGERTGSLAMAKSHLDVFNTVVDGELEDLKHIWIEQAIRPLIVLNFGELEEGYGDFGRVPRTPEEQRLLAEIVEILTDRGYLDTNVLQDWQRVRGDFGLDTDEKIFEESEPEPEPGPTPAPEPKEDKPERMRRPVRLLPHLSRQAA